MLPWNRDIPQNQTVLRHKTRTQQLNEINPHQCRKLQYNKETKLSDLIRQIKSEGIKYWSGSIKTEVDVPQTTANQYGKHIYNGFAEV